MPKDHVSIQKMTITLYCDSGDVSAIKYNFEEFFYNADAPMYHPKEDAFIKVQDAPAEEITNEMRDWFDSLL